ncbi:aminoglycoside phosphotransferase [Beutenbergia cavernae DSM 12333]|uniref:Aminoglycoside phosphotransferase n=1 Tax=Beutenbergia cavernae (strain ATCC BAA-8 / DSM 12333 / CCUG 43141 / JCM 11478 / NBRC 16432 / NCIMB 13614 / HKI 0122) TaxID=471853 RepID=C5BXL0_BEUC1|nr:aminoglycoside phosphotransferase family protein [Beutenbergia cavernae]ACQ80893.1 aminoglycoside phosphotransferase [Beutenbergia cavernae DSM 12333]
MFTPPPEIPDERAARAVRVGWDLDVVDVAYAPVGFGSHHWNVRTRDGGRHFLTMDDLRAKRTHADEPLAEPRRRLVAALVTARHLRDAGLEFVIAPERSVLGRVCLDGEDEFVAALYPFVEGRTHAYGAYPDPAARDAVVRLLVRLHGVGRTTAPLALPDDLTIPSRAGLEGALAGHAPPSAPGPFTDVAAEALATHAAAVLDGLARYDALTTRLDASRFVLTHGEPHAANTITTASGPVLIDWDTAAFAPPERDLWSLVDQDPGIADDYEARTGTAVEPAAVELYRLRWDLAEVALYTAQFRAAHVASDDTRTAWDGLQESLSVLAT